MRLIEADVAVIGSGAAGIMAALEAQARGSKVVLAGKGSVGKGGCTSMVHGFFAASSAQWSIKEHRLDTLEAGRGLNVKHLVDVVVGKAADCLGRLTEMGVPLLEFAEGYSVDNLGNAKEVPGIRLVEAMAALVADRAIHAMEQFHCLNLVVEDNRVAGVAGVDSSGTPTFIRAPSVVLATGGAAAIYLRNDNPAGIMGEGYFMALKAGCELQDMEFVQFYPVGIAELGLPAAMVYPPYPDRARLVDSDGGDVLEELPGCRNLLDAVVRFRDTASLLFYRKHVQGGLFLDLTEVEDNDWECLNSLRLIKRNRFDFRSKTLRVAPLAHFSIGGVVVNEHAETSVAGLFAAGEVTGGVHGANRLGGNALSECIVCGGIAGTNAADYSKKASRPFGLAAAEASMPAWAGRNGDKAAPQYRDIIKKIRMGASEYGGVIRSGVGMRKGLEFVAKLERDLDRMVPTGNCDGLLHARACAAAFTLRCILQAGLLREESRGALFREDYPEPDDANWHCNIRISYNNSSGHLVLKKAMLGQSEPAVKA